MADLAQVRLAIERLFLPGDSDITNGLYDMGDHPFYNDDSDRGAVITEREALINRVFVTNQAVQDPPPTPWMRITLHDLESGIDALGGAGHRKFRRRAQLIVQHFFEEGIGSECTECMERTRRLLEGKRLHIGGASIDAVINGVQLRIIPPKGRPDLAFHQENAEADVIYYQSGI